jgi:hypothetical protein
MTLTNPQDADEQLGTLDAMLARHVERIADAVRSPKPIHTQRTVVLAGSVSVIALGVLGVVPIGRMWNITGVTVVGADPFTAFAQPVALAIGTAQLDPATNTARNSDVAVPALTAPVSTWLTPGTLWANSSEDVYAIVKAGTAGQLIVTVAYDDWPDTAQLPVGL